MTTLRNDAQGRQMELSTGNFSISPRYGNNGKIEGWQGQAEIVLQGRDFVRITQAAAKVQDMTLASMSFGLSREAREKVEGEAQAKAIESFRQRAAAISKSFGFAGYSLREVNVSSSGGGGKDRPGDRLPAWQVHPRSGRIADHETEDARPQQSGLARRTRVDRAELRAVRDLALIRGRKKGEPPKRLAFLFAPVQLISWPDPCG